MLREHADNFRMCHEVLATFKYLSEMTIRCIFLSWSRNCLAISRTDGGPVLKIKRKKLRHPEFEDIVEFVEEAAEEADNIVYGTSKRL